MISKLACLFLGAAAALAVSCSSSELEVRSIKAPLAEGRQPADFRVAEGHSQLALGNVGLALEAYRKALREQPESLEAMVGLATCYDKMGRFDLSRRHYEMALAIAPANHELHLLFAQSLDAQGQRDEAARVRTELAARSVAPEAPRVAPGSVPVLPPPPAQSVTVALAPPRSVPVAVEPAKPGVRLERLSMGEVALVTSERPRWQSSTVARTATSITIRFDKQPSSRVTLLNAARVQGLAARTRTFLTKRGFGPAVIGDAPAIRQKSLISFAAADRPLAERLAAQFGFALERRQDKGALTILLGRDAAGDGAIGRPRG